MGLSTVRKSPFAELSRRAGKRRSDIDGQDLFVQKRKSGRKHGHGYTPKGTPSGRYELDRRRSPLAGAVTNVSPGGGIQTRPAGAGTPSSAAISQPSYDNTPGGFDKDTAQIVNLALSLGESRRLASAGAGRHLPNAGLRDKRVSSAHRASPTPKQPEPSWRDLVQPPEDANLSRQRMLAPSPRISETYPDDGGYDFSDATIARAEKVRKHFELWAEYVKLLPHLPPLRTPTTNRDQGEEADNFGGGREYNPLQYIRNRKVRFREKSAINTEASGWEDIERVHAWVDNIAASHDQIGNQPNECVQLPPLSPGQHAEDSMTAFSPVSTTSSRPQATENKPKRPRMDWLFSPSDLLADAAWLEQDSNKAKIEDGDGKKIFPSETGFRVVSLTAAPAPRPATPSQEIEKPTILKENERDSLKAEPLPSFTSLASQSPQRGHRGRKRHRLVHSINITPSHSHVRRSSKSRWHKALGRSRDPSASSGCSSSDEDGGWRKKLSKWYSDVPSHPETEGLDMQRRPESALETPMRHRRRDKPISPRESFLGPLQDDCVPRIKAPSHQRSYTHSVASTSDKDGSNSRRLSLADAGSNSHLTTPAPHFPSIAINLSPPRSRSSSPSKDPLPFGLGSARRDVQNYSIREPGTVSLDFSPVQRHMYTEDRSKTDIRHIESLPTKLRRGASQQESKIRGMFKGGRIAELVGNEVSKVGDFIRKRDAPGHSRSSSVSSVFSDYAAVEDGGKGKAKVRSSKALPEMEVVPYKPPVWITPGLDRPASDLALGSKFSNQDDNQMVGGRGNMSSDALRPKDPTPVQKVVFRPTSRERQRPESQQQPSRPKLTEATRNWSMSSRSITRQAQSSSVNKREIAAVRAHLLSSGTKALQIRRTARNTMCSKTPNEFNALHAISSCEAVLAARNFMSTFDSRASALRHSMSSLSQTKVPALVSELDRLEFLVNTSLAPRMRTMTAEADQLTGELTTTRTLAVKQLNDALDRGIRKRNRRFRRISRLGFVMLEWSLVGVMWVVWMIVMVFRIARGVWRGAVGGVRWVLWL